MATLLGIGMSALNAAQVGLSTTGHNIANAATPGYNRQIVTQTTPKAESAGFGFAGGGTSVASVTRVYSDFLNNQVLTAQTSQNQLASYYTQIQQVNNLLADPTTGLSPSVQDFFKGVQVLASDPASGASRQTMLAGAESLAAKFQSMDAQLNELRQGVNSQVTSSLTNINTYSTQIAALNDAIAKAQLGNEGRPANDLLDQRDQVISDLSKEIQVSVVNQGDNFSVFVGNGQPLVVGNQAFKLVPLSSPTDLSRVQVGYQSNGITVALAENSISGGKLGGLFEFRANTLDTAQNSLGRIAIGLATTFNAQHALGQDQNGALGGDFFTVAAPVVTANTANTSAAQVSASIGNVNALTTSDYQIQYDGTNYKVTRSSDNTVLANTTLAAAQTAALTQGFSFSVTGTPAAGDAFSIKPTIAGASGFDVAITDKAKIAAAAPIRTGTVLANSGSGTISPGTVDASYSAATVTPAVTLTYSSSTNTLSGFSGLLPVTVTSNGVATVYAAGTPITYTSGATISFGGISLAISGGPANGDTYIIGANTNGVGDGRNALLLGALQTANTLDNGTSNYQSAFGQMINMIGNKTRELEVTSTAAATQLTSAVRSQQSNSGVNLDEEAANLLRYQQAYQAAGKMMQTADKMFDVLLSLGS